jgi:hypothetical protein
LTKINLEKLVRPLVLLKRNFIKERIVTLTPEDTSYNTASAGLCGNLPGDQT